MASARGQAASPQPPCVPASGDLHTYAARLDRVWGTRTTLLMCDGARVPFGSNPKPGTVYFVPQQAVISALMDSGSSTSSPTSGATKCSSSGWGYKLPSTP